MFCCFFFAIFGPSVSFNAFDAMVNYREVPLFVNGEEVMQLCVVGVAAERFWHEAFHQRRGLSSLQWSDVTSVNLVDVVRKDDKGRPRKYGRLQVDLRLQ